MKEARGVWFARDIGLGKGEIGSLGKAEASRIVSEMANEPRQVERMQPKACSHHAAHAREHHRIGECLLNSIGKPQQDPARNLRHERTGILVQAPRSLRDAVGTAFDRGTLETLALTG
jgi:hypothetical protein